MVKRLDQFIACQVVTLRDVELSWGQIAKKLEQKKVQLPNQHMNGSRGI